MEQTRTVRFDKDKLEYLRVAKGLTVESIIKKSGTPPLGNGVDFLERRTVTGALSGKPRSLDTILRMARIFGYDDPIPLLAAEDVPLVGPPSSWQGPASFLAKVQEWDVTEVVEPTVQAANGLKYEVCRLRHRLLPNRWARGKCFDLSGISTRERARISEYFYRHPEVCARLAGQPHFARNLTATMDPTGQFWWCLDDWRDGETLMTRFERGPVSTEEAANLLRQVAIGLQSLHHEGIIRRELSPRNILLCPPKQVKSIQKDQGLEVVLTDFELAKLLDGSPTVSPAKQWPDDDYRAPELRPGGPADARADIYSWGRVLVHAVVGKLPPRKAEENALKQVSLPTRIRQIVLECVNIAPSARPTDIGIVLKKISTWK